MRFRATLGAAGTAAVLGLALGSGCGSTPPPSNQQTVAWSAPIHPGHAAAARRCTGERVKWRTGTNFGITGSHDFGSAWFTANPNRCSYLKDQILCLDTQSNSYYTKTSSAYRGVGVVDKIACDLDDNGERFSLDVNGHWRELCTRGGNPACAWGLRHRAGAVSLTALVAHRVNPPCGADIAIYLTNSSTQYLTGHGAGNAMTLETYGPHPPLYHVTCVSGVGQVFHPLGTSNCVIEDSATRGSGFVITSSDCSVGRRIWQLNCATGAHDWINTGNDFAIVYTLSDNSGTRVRYQVGLPLPNGSWSNWSC